MIACLPMYDRPETVSAFDLLWSHIRDSLVESGIDGAPKLLARGNRPSAAWTNSHLLLSQTCSLPFRTYLKGKVSLVGTPDYGYESVPKGFYFSCLIANVEDARRELSQFNGCRLAFNEISSQSGWAAPMDESKRAGIQFGSFLRTGSHRASALAIAEKRADLAALDVNSWRLIERFDAVAASLRVLGTTCSTPGLPFVTAFPDLSGTLFDAIENSLMLLPDDAAEIVGFGHLVRLTESQYLAVDNPPSHIPGPCAFANRTDSSDRLDTELPVDSERTESKLSC
ncbi:MAG: PhnD/SsuA/transferrin family substrate-binding protein [Albidovulum sp.]|nr:PhnD/SsuA/transferrin family substrate-binding protein [Albidovulum sp.]